MLRSKWGKKLLLYAVLALLLAGAVRQIVRMAGPEPESADAAYLLYQVTLYQIELLNSSSGDAAAARDTKELTPLKTALYAASYAHERLVLAEGGNERLTPLESLLQLQQYLERLQVGGSRPLKADEKETLQGAAEQLGEMYAIYAELMSSGHEVLSSKNEALHKLDEELAGRVRQKLLQ